MISDDALVEAVKRGELAAFDQLMRRYEKLICKVAMNYVKDRQNALDVTQDVFLKAYRNLDSVRAEGMFKPWLLRITYNESINWIRKHRRQASEITLDEWSGAASPAVQESSVLDRENRRRVLQGLVVLNPKYRLAVALRYAEGLRVREIADVMECSEGMVKSLLFRGVRQIKRNVERSA